MKLALVAFAAVMLAASAAPAQVGRMFASETTVRVDARTGRELRVLTDGRFDDARIYHTRPQWTSDGQWIVFRSVDRAPGEQAFAVHERSGAIVQLTEGEGYLIGTAHLSRRAMRMFVLRRVPLPPGTTPPTPRPEDALLTQLVEIDLAAVLADAAGGVVGGRHDRVVATLPPGVHESGGMGLDAEETAIFVGVRGLGVGDHLPPGVTPYPTPPGARMGAGPGGIRRIDLRTGQVSVILDTPFQVGHVQANPFVPGELMYCWETGGKAPQRMWLVNADGTGNRPLFPEQRFDWITHEVFVTRDEIVFNLIGHRPELRTRPTGIALLNLRTGAVTLLGQVDEHLGPDADFPGTGGFWHCHGSQDGRWAVGDTFAGDIWLIRRDNGARTLLTSGHRMRPDHAHPSFSPDGSRVLLQSGKWTEGRRLQLVVVQVE